MKIEKWGWYSIGINILLAGIGLAVAVSSGSLAVKTEILHNVVDLLTAIAVLAGLRIAGRKTRKFPYGLYKVENIITVIMAMMIFFAAYEMARHAVFAPSLELTVTAWHLTAIIVAAGIALGFSILESRAGQLSNSPALIADAKEYRVHILTTGVVFVALAGHDVDFPIDRVAAVIVLTAIGKTGWDLLVSGVRVLLDASLDPSAIAQIEEMISSEPQVAEVHWVTGRNSGRVRFVEAEVSLRINDLDKAEKITTRIENNVKQGLENIERVVIHAEPKPPTHTLCAIPLKDDSDELCPHLGEAPSFAFLKIRNKDRKVESQDIKSNPFTHLEKGKGIKVAEWLVNENIDYVIVKKSLQGKGPEYVFRDAGVEMSKTDKDTLNATMEEILNQTA
jgi:cation diffusion facilitator family transporter